MPPPDEDLRTPTPQRPAQHRALSGCYFRDAQQSGPQSNQGASHSTARDGQSSLSANAPVTMTTTTTTGLERPASASLSQGQRPATRSGSPSLSSSWASPVSSNGAGVDAAVSGETPGPIRSTETGTVMTVETQAQRPMTASTASLSSFPISAPSGLQAPSTTYEEEEESDPAMASGPTLLMPQIQRVPSKPLTTHGRRVGKLRILFCGAKGVGKTTLLRTIAETCPDVVFCEAVRGIEPGRTTNAITEIKASTQPYPAWKVRSRSGRQAPSAPEDASTLLERNLTLVDTPGFPHASDVADADACDDTIECVLDYLDNQFEKTNRVLRDTLQLSDEDLANLIAAPGGGLSQIDIVVYCLSREMTRTDASFISRLAGYATVLPVLTKSDELDEAALAHLTTQVQAQAVHLYDTERILKVCCRDPEMDASLLMRASYQPTLPGSDLPLLFSTLLHGEGPARFRHLAARKFICWKQRHDARACAAPALSHEEEDAVMVQDAQAASLLTEDANALVPSAAFTVSRIAEHTRRATAGPAELRIAAWASEMTQSLAAQRAVSLSTGVQMPGEVLQAVQSDQPDWILSRRQYYEDASQQEQQRQPETPGTACSWERGRRRYIMTLPNHFSASAARDPLGLIEMKEKLSRCAKRVGGWLVDIGVVSGVGFLCWTWLQSIVAT